MRAQHAGESIVGANARGRFRFSAPAKPPNASNSKRSWPRQIGTRMGKRRRRDARRRTEKVSRLTRSLCHRYGAPSTYIDSFTACAAVVNWRRSTAAIDDDERKRFDSFVCLTSIFPSWHTRVRAFSAAQRQTDERKRTTAAAILRVSCGLCCAAADCRAVGEPSMRNKRQRLTSKDIVNDAPPPTIVVKLTNDDQRQPVGANRTTSEPRQLTRRRNVRV